MRPLFAELKAVALAAAIAGCQDSATTAGPRGPSDDSPSFSANSSTTQSHFVGNGLAGDLSWCTNEGNPESYYCLYLTVARGGPTNNPETYLYYYAYRCDPSFCNTVDGGYGLIPNGDLAGTAKELHLSTNTSSNADFLVWAGTGGLVSVDWRSNGAYTASFSGRWFTQQLAPPCDTICTPPTQHVLGAWTQRQATAIGTVAGVAIPSSYGNITENHSVTIDIYR